ncbi:N(G),N(G)-dimethylarginine dimethylaminohydrolase 1-like isoform X4 [Lineus longissimus]|uniref:N(G),N(G)-dimethylarginine dimethylaminohydrolase 1-like isoform X4 n=1 Tax=Lineus longissimus TaxID=88925 RepID=UPI00315CA07C
MAAPFKYNYAIVSRIPDSFKKQHPDVDLEHARADLEKYVDLLRRLGIDVLELPADEKHPECVNVDDTAVVINGTALMCCPPERQGEVNVIRQTLRRELGLKIVEIQNPSKVALEGGDVLFTGKEIIVALSQQTNEAGAQAVASAFPEYATTPVKIPNGYHLKDLVCMAGRDIMIHGSSRTVEDIMRNIRRACSYGYRRIHLEDDHGANLCYINGTLCHLGHQHVSRATYGTLENKIDFPRQALDMESLLKGESCLTRVAMLVGKAKYPKKIVSTLD